MSDYILHNRELFEGSTVLELGAGVGVVSIVASLMGAEYVLCTGLYPYLSLSNIISLLSLISHMYTPTPYTYTQ